MSDQVDIGPHETRSGLEDGWIDGLDVVPEGCGEQIRGYWLDVDFVFVPEEVQTRVFVDDSITPFCLVVVEWPDVGTPGGGRLQLVVPLVNLRST